MPNPRSEWKVRKLRTAVALRDGWRCHRCGESIDPTLRYPDPMSVSLEHVLEIDAGGDPYDPGNCTVSHLVHNQSAGASYGNRKRHRPLASREW